MAAAVWSVNAPSAAVDPDGTVLASFALKDAGASAVTVTFTMTAKRGLVVNVVTEPGVDLTDFRAWMS